MKITVRAGDAAVWGVKSRFISIAIESENQVVMRLK